MQEIFKKLHFIINLVYFLSFCYNIDIINVIYVTSLYISRQN